MRILLISALLLTVVSSLIMKRIAGHFRFKDGHSFSIIDLEKAPSEAQLHQFFDEMDDDAKGAVRAQLHADYLFMCGCYPLIAILSLIAARKTNVPWRNVWYILAILQLLPFAFDVTENLVLEQSMHSSVDWISFKLFQMIVQMKFAIALSGFLLSSSFLFVKSL